MSTLLIVGVTLGVLWVLAAVEGPFWAWVAALGASLAVATGVHGLGLGTGILWGAWGLVAVLAIPVVRLALWTRPLRAMTRRALPPVSVTEREALDAGTVWWDADLFSGRPRWDRLMDHPAPRLTADEQAFLDGPVEELCRRLDDWEITHTLRDLPEEAWSFIKEKGFLGMIIPKEHGGHGFSAEAHSAVVQKVASRSSSAAVSVMVPNSLGPAELLLHYGTEEQKRRHLGRLARGEEIPCFALTSPVAGSDAASMPDRGVVCRGRHDGADVLGISLTFDKRYITLAPVATLIGLAFRLDDPDHLLGDVDSPGITVALIPADHPGMETGPRHDVAKQAMLNGTVRGRDVFIPVDWVIGGKERIGQGWRMLMDCLSAGRALSLPATSTAAAKLCARTTGAYARVRKQFKLPLGKFEGVAERLGRIAGETYLLEAARSVTAAAVDAGEKPSVISALLKYQSTERMRVVVNDAMDIHGGRAICEGPANYLSNAYQFIPVAITVEGANILTRTLIVFGQGALRCHPWLLKEMEAATSTDDRAGLLAFDAAFAGHIKFTLANSARALLHNLTGGLFVRAPLDNPTIRRWMRQVERAALSFSVLSDAALLTLGGNLKRKEMLSGRFADALSELYLSSCVLKRFHDDACPTSDRHLLEWNLRRSLCNIQESFHAILQNLPNRPCAWVLRPLVFPLGRRRMPPSDRLTQAVAESLLEAGPVRDRITRGIYVSQDPGDITGRLEHALRLVAESDPVERRLRDAQRAGRLTSSDPTQSLDEAQAQGLITLEEASTVRQSRDAVAAVIAVDVFPRESFAPPAACSAVVG
jgi:acyl-CoA dehydrogenase